MDEGRPIPDSEKMEGGIRKGEIRGHPADGRSLTLPAPDYQAKTPTSGTSK